MLTPLPVPANATAMNWNQLITLICQYIQGNISSSVSFFQQGSTPPPFNQGIFFNLVDNRFENWDQPSGGYIPISERSVGDVYQSFISGDVLTGGLVLLDGRAVNTVGGLTQNQANNLATLFGANSVMPTAPIVVGIYSKVFVGYP